MIQHKTSKVILDSFSLLGENYEGYIKGAVIYKANIGEDSCTADGCIFPIQEVMITETSRSQLAIDRSQVQIYKSTVLQYYTQCLENLAFVFLYNSQFADTPFQYANIGPVSPSKSSYSV